MKNLKIFQGLNKLKQMKILYGIFLVLIVFVSACAQQAAQQVQPAPAPEPVAVAPEEEAEPEAAEGTGAAVAPQEKAETANEIRYLGAGGFEPDELTIKAGSAVTWINDDEKLGAVIFFKDGKSFTNSGRLAPDGKFEYEFTETGEYEFWWNLPFGGVGGKLTVE